jgi:hypothetical protein
MKMCTKCKIEKEEVFFSKSSPWCKVCKSEWRKVYYAAHKEEIKIKHAEHIISNHEKIKTIKKNWYDNNKEHIKVKHKQYYEENKKIIKEKARQYYIKNREIIKEKAKVYQKTEKGKEVNCIHHSNRRVLGYKPINQRFEGSEYHHMHLKNSKGIVDTDIGVYIPKNLHKSIYHSSRTGIGLSEINNAAFVWCFEELERKLNNVAEMHYDDSSIEDMKDMAKKNQIF